MLAGGFISTVGPVLLVAGAIVLVISLGRLLRKRERTAGGAGSDPGTGSVRRLREAADREIARIDEHARDARAQMETKIHLMNGLLVRAEKVIARLGEAGGEGAVRGAAGRSDPRFAQVYRLADEGLDPAEIASRTEFERGEVELILGLRTKGPDKQEGGS